jgi:hypothetical protein
MNKTKLAARHSADYDRDFHAWAVEQAARLRAARPPTVDWENLAEEIESLGKRDRRKVASDLNKILEHLIKWRYQPEKRKTGWRGSIREHRDRIARILADSPSLQRLPADLLADEYRKARAAALEDTGLPEDRIPVRCPFSARDVLDADYLPEAERS